MLDPACGSLHFGLYAFDLYERIYDEAWELEERLGPDAFVRSEGLLPLHESYPDKAAFLRDVPRLIIERNIHGIDIDPRAVQIAGLSLWLRAQRSWQAQGVKPQDRPQIRRSNIVCAEPMPGNEALLEEFLKSLRADRLESLIRRVLDVPANQRVRATPTMADALCDLVRTVWKEMALAGEAGSLLKIEEALTDAIARSKAEWEERTLPLFRVQEFGLTDAVRGIATARGPATDTGGLRSRGHVRPDAEELRHVRSCAGRPLQHDHVGRVPASAVSIPVGVCNEPQRSSDQHPVEPAGRASPGLVARTRATPSEAAIPAA